MIKWLLCVCLLIGSLHAEVTNHRVLFSPQDHLAEELISMIEKERTSIKAAVFCLSHRQIMKALTYAQDRGVDVQVIVDPFSLHTKTLAKQIQKTSFPIFVWNPSPEYRKLKNGKTVQRKKGLMHDKFCVFGDDRVWTGSFNFTLDGTSINQENALIVESKEIASSYLTEFERLKRSSCVDLQSFLKEKEDKN